MSGWAERIWVNGAEADFERAVAPRSGRTQLPPVRRSSRRSLPRRSSSSPNARWRSRSSRRVWAGDTGDNVVDAEIVLLTNVCSSTPVLEDDGGDREACRGSRGQVVVLPDNHYEKLVPSAEIVTGMREGRPKSSSGARPRLSHASASRGASSGADELWDGAHTPAGAAWLRERIDEPVAVAVASILADKDADAMLHDLAALAAPRRNRPTIRARWPSNSPREPSRTFRKSRSSPTRTARSRVRDNPVPG